MLLQNRGLFEPSTANSTAQSGSIFGQKKDDATSGSTGTTSTGLFGANPASNNQSTGVTFVLLHRPPPMKRQKNPNQLALSVPNQQIVQQVQAQQGYLLVLKTKQLVQLAVEAYLGPRKINLQHQREDYSALQQQVRCQTSK